MIYVYEYGAMTSFGFVDGRLTLYPSKEEDRKLMTTPSKDPYQLLRQRISEKTGYPMNAITIKGCHKVGKWSEYDTLMEQASNANMKAAKEQRFR
ncbi:MAG: hypothetical protein LUD51_07045 [Clostridia bacterium]|nr:hypothetical protein [Clostridia bacterium]